MISDRTSYSRVLKVSKYYRYILTSQLLIPDFAKRELHPEGGLGALLQNIGAGTETAVREYQLDLPAGKANALKSMMLAMLCTKRCAGDPECIIELDKLHAECMKYDPQTSQYRFNFAMLYLAVDAVDRCVAELEETICIFPGFGQVHAALALLYTINEEWGKGLVQARAALARGAEIRPRLVNLCLSSCSYKLNQPIEGAFDYVALDKYDPDHLVKALQKLPPVDQAQLDHSGHDKRVLFTYADEKYFYEHALALICSLRDTDADWAIHLHLCNPSPKLLQDLPRLQQLVSPLLIHYSFEHADIARYGDPAFYHCSARFARLYQLVVSNPHTFVMVDADALINKNPDNLTGLNDPGKVVGLTATDCEPFWATIRGGFSYFRRSDAALQLLGRLAHFIIDNMQPGKGHWFLDMMGLSLLYDKLPDQKSVAVLPASECCDSNYGDDATIWAIVNDKVSMGKYNIRKLEVLKRYGIK